jgi:hypothetical protein
MGSTSTFYAVKPNRPRCYASMLYGVRPLWKQKGKDAARRNRLGCLSWGIELV